MNAISSPILNARPRRPAMQSAKAVIARLGKLFAGLRFQMERQRQRRQLARLDDRLLADIGVSREQADQEAGKCPWQD